MMAKDYKLSFSEEAEKDIGKISEYISTDLNSPKAALNLIKEIRKATKRIKNFPFTGQAIEKKYGIEFEYRRYTVKNYNIFYIVDGNTITIMKIMHQRRSYNNLK